MAIFCLGSASPCLDRLEIKIKHSRFKSIFNSQKLQGTGEICFSWLCVVLVLKSE